MPRLYLIQPTQPRRGTPPSWAPRPYNLQRQPQRPGELSAEIRIASAPSNTDVATAAARAGLPESLWATLAVESRRVVAYVAETFEANTGAVTTLLDNASNRHAPAGDATSRSRLAAYAAALSAAQSNDATSAIGPILLRPSATMLSAWNIAADRDRVNVDSWAQQHLEHHSGTFIAWETAAAFSGQTLAEWALAHAARRLRSRSTAPQTAA
jgi:hypothetical protein